MNWHDRFKAMKRHLNLTNSDISEITGNTYNSVKTTTQPNKDLPRWARLAVVVFERMKQKSNL